jgi:hypothetical protein
MQRSAPHKALAPRAIGFSARIENYAGFPTGLSGRELALRSYLQGAE